MAAEVLLLQLAILLVLLALAASLAHLLGQSVIPFYLGVGLLVDHDTLDLPGIPLSLAGLETFITAAAQLGIVLLLFFLGLKFSIQSLVRNRSRIVRAGTIDLLNLAVGIVAGLVIGFDWFEALFLGGVVYISSSAVITKALIDMEWIANPESERILGILVFEDLFVAVYLMVLGALAFQGGSMVEVLGRVGLALSIMVSLVILAFYGSGLVGKLLNTPSDELALLRAVAVTVTVAAAALMGGLSEAVAAFFVGLAFSGTEHVRRLSRLADPLRDLFGALFFFWIGLTADLAALVGLGGLLVVLVLVSGASKVVTGIMADRALSPGRRVRVGLALVPRGEFSLVIAALAALVGGSEVLETVLPTLAVAYVLATSVLGTVAMHHSHLLESLLSPWIARTGGGGSQDGEP